MNLSQLRNTIAVAEYDGFSSAARALNISQPSITKSIQALEEELGVRLFIRGRRGARLTDFGITWLRYARAAQAELNHGLVEIDAMKAGLESRVGIAGSPITLPRLLPAAIARTRHEYPNTIIASSDAVGLDPDSQLKGLGDGSLDVVFSMIAPQWQRESLAYEPLFDVQLKVVARQGHPLSTKSDLDWKDVLPYSWCRSQGDNLMAEHVRPWFGRVGLQYPSGPGVTTSSQVLRNGVIRESDLLAIAAYHPACTVEEREGLVFLPFEQGPPLWTIGAITREHATMPAAVEAIIRHMKELVGENETN